MIRQLAKKEILENLTTYRFYILTGLLAILIIVSIIVSYGDYRVRLENYNILRPPTNSANAMTPPDPLSIFVRGLDENIGRLYELSLTGIEVHSGQQSINRLFSLFTVPDMLFIIRLLLAVIALLFSFDAISGEKEAGTLKLMLSAGSSRITILFGKLLGRFVLVFVPFSVLFLGAAVTVSLLPDVGTGAYFWQRMIVLGFIAGVYTLIFTALGIVISSMVSRSSTSMVIGLGIWVLFTFIIPAMGVTAAKSFADIPPADRVEMEGRLSTIHAIYDRIQKEAKGDTRAGLEMVRQIRESNSRLFDTYRPKFARLTALTKNILRLSPSGALTFLTTDVANTGILEEARLKDAITLHFNRNWTRIVQLEQGPPGPFTFSRGALSDVLSQSAFVDGFVLLLFAAGFVALAMNNLFHYDPR